MTIYNWATNFTLEEAKLITHSKYLKHVHNLNKPIIMKPGDKKLTLNANLMAFYGPSKVLIVSYSIVVLFTIT